jgi:hypothetical protein
VTGRHIPEDLNFLNRLIEKYVPLIKKIVMSLLIISDHLTIGKQAGIL